MTVSLTPFERAKQIAGGTNQKLGDLLGVSKQAVGQWNGVMPLKQAIVFEERSGGQLTRWDLRPDLFGERAT